MVEVYFLRETVFLTVKSHGLRISACAALSTLARERSGVRDPNYFVQNQAPGVVVSY
jgi:hypothetical protein